MTLGAVKFKDMTSLRNNMLAMETNIHSFGAQDVSDHDGTTNQPFGGQDH